MSAESTNISEEPSTSSNAAEAKKSESQEKKFARFRSLIITEYGFTATAKENYLKRLQNLRNELNYINDTEWMYEPLEKKPTQY